VIGVDGEPAAAFQVAVPGPYPGVSGQETLQITAPAELGTYGVFANRFSVTTEQDARDEYVARYPSMDRRTFEFIQLGTLTVE
jgi:hypothetical protein